MKSSLKELQMKGERKNPLTPVAYRVRSKRREMEGTYTLVVEPSDGSRLEAAAPGQFNMLYVFGVGEVPISVSGEAERGETLYHTVRAVGEATKALCGLKKGATLGMRGPFGSGWRMDEAKGRDLVIVAGGIGLAPLRPVVHEALARREDYGRVFLLYGARSPEDILYRREVEKWRGRFDLDVEVTVDRASSAWRGGVGVVTKLIEDARFDPKRATAMLCGPEVMMRFSVRELRKRGVDDRDIYLSMERNMKCAVGFCGRCQFGPEFICKDGPVLRYDRIGPWFGKREI